MLAVAGATLAYAVAGRVEFDSRGGFVAPTQLAFVPLLVVAPAHCSRSPSGSAWLLARVPDLVGGRSSAARLWVALEQRLDLARPGARPDRRRRA